MRQTPFNLLRTIMRRKCYWSTKWSVCMFHWLQERVWYHRTCWANEAAPSTQSGWKLRHENQQEILLGTKGSNLWEWTWQLCEDQRGVRLRCLLSAKLFPCIIWIHHERQIEDPPAWHQYWWPKRQHLRYADNTALNSSIWGWHAEPANILTKESESLSVGLNIKKS